VTTLGWGKNITFGVSGFLGLSVYNNLGATKSAIQKQKATNNNLRYSKGMIILESLFQCLSGLWGFRDTMIQGPQSATKTAKNVRDISDKGMVQYFKICDYTQVLAK